MNKQILFVTSGRLAVYQWENGKFGNPLVFLADEEGLTQFGLYLEHAPKDKAYMLVDFVEEEFREDTVPHVMGMDRRAMIQTKQNRLFRNPTYSHAIFQGRQPEGRRDDNMLFTALIRPDLLTPWMAQITAHKVALAGIYSLPLISEQILKLLKIDSPRALLVSLQSAGGLRQTFFMNGQLKLSRLAMMPQVQDKGYASYVLSEVEKIRRYLNSLRMLPNDTPLDVHLLGDAQLLADMGQQSEGADNVRHHLHDLAEVAVRLKLKDPYSSRYADRIFAHLLAHDTPPNQYATAEQTKYHVMHRMRGGLRAASITLLVGSAFWGGVKFIEGVSAARETTSIENQVSFYSERYRRARSRLPETPAESRDMQQAVELAGTMREAKTWPYPMLAALSIGLQRFPNIKVEQLYWRSSTDANARIGRSGSNRTARNVIQNLLSSDRGSRGQTGAGEAKESFYQLALVKGRVDPFAGDFRAALDMVRNFAETLRSLEAVKDVQVIALPLDIGSENSLSGNATTDGSTGEAPFEIRIVLLERELGSG